MNKKALTAATVIFGLISLLTIGLFAIIIYLDEFDQEIGRYISDSMHKTEIVAENLKITNEWTEITSEKPLKPTKTLQNLELLVIGYKYNINKKDYGNIRLTNGKQINLEVEIIGDNGKIYRLKDSTRRGNLIGYSPNKKIHGISSFPKNISYTTIRIRSNKPILCEQIIWYDYDLK